MKKFILYLLFLFSGNELMGMDRGLYFLCHEKQSCPSCLETIIEIEGRAPKGSVFGLPCCYTATLAKESAVKFLCNTCLAHLQTFNRQPTFAEEAATIEDGGFKPQYLCPISRHDLNEYRPVLLTNDNIVRGNEIDGSIEQPAATKKDARLLLFRRIVLKNVKDKTLEANKADLLVQFPMFNRSDIDFIINGPENASFRKIRNSRNLAFIVAGTAGGYGLYLVSRMIFKAEGIDQLEKSALSGQESLLSLNFDLSNPIPSLSKQYDIPAMLKTIQDEALRQQLEQAVSEFDAALEKTYSTIANSYYYHPALYFLEKEPTLVAQLKLTHTQLQSVIDECKKQSAVGYSDIIKCGLATGIAAACGYYWAKASTLKKWGLF